MAAVTRVMEADDMAYNAHEDAEDVFAEAEKRMSTSGAREGARKALEAYDLHEEGDSQGGSAGASEVTAATADGIANAIGYCTW